MRVTGLWIAAAVCAGAVLGPGVPALGATTFWLPSDFGANNPFRLAAVGDSITQGVLGDGTCANLDCVADRPYPAVLEALLAAGHPGFVMLNRGRRGETTSGSLDRLGSVLAQDHPGFVPITAGDSARRREGRAGRSATT